VTKEATEKAMVMLVMARRRCASKGRFGGSLAGVLFPVVHLLQELFRLFLVDERQPCKTFFQFEGVEKDAILVIAPCVEYFLIPYDTAVSGRDVYHLDPIGVANQIICQHNGALKTRIRPS